MGTGTLLGFDYGPRKIGVAVGQQVTATAAPLTTLRCRDERPDWPILASLAADSTAPAATSTARRRKAK